MYCKVCRHNFNTGESYVQIGDIAICADCAFKTTVRDLATKSVFPVITMDDGAIPVDFVVDGKSSLETHSDYVAGKQVLSSEYGTFAYLENSATEGLETSSAATEEKNERRA